MLISFEQTQTFAQQINIEDVGNACVKCTNEMFCDYFLITKTIRGVTHYLEFGPIAQDSMELLPTFTLSYGTIKFNEKKLFGLFTKFLNTPSRQITSAQTDESEFALDSIPDIGKLFRHIS